MCLTRKYTERGIAGAHGFMAERIVEHREWVIPVPDTSKPRPCSPSR